MSQPKKKKAAMDSAMRKREEGFDIVSIPHAKLTEYSALHDPNMRHYFENPKVQRLLYETGQIDKHGRVIDLNRNKAKLNILEREFKKAEEAEEARIKEEEEMRYRVQRTRFNELERTRKRDLLLKMKADINLSKEMLSTMRSSITMPPVPSSRSLARSRPSRSPMQSPGNDAFFLTEEGKHSEY